MYWNSIKNELGRFCAEQVPNNSTIGLGSGTTSEAFIRALGERNLKETLCISCIASSNNSERIAREFNLPIIDQAQWKGAISIMFDGADAIDTDGNAIKGAGGALVREKILIHSAQKVVIMVDERKWCLPWKSSLLPVAIVPFGAQATMKALSFLKCKGTLRMKNASPFLTDDGLWIIDLSLEEISSSPEELDVMLKAVPGVVETGIFLGIASSIVIGYQNGKIEQRIK